MMNLDQLAQMRDKTGFIAALDQSGGSTPKALAAYGINADAYTSEPEMFDQIHTMRSRIVNAPDFTGNKVIGAILFEKTMERDIGGKPSPKYLWENRGVVPFLKIDKGLMPQSDGVQLMKNIPDLDRLLPQAAELGVFGTKMRSVISEANPEGIRAIVAQQIAIGQRVLSFGLVPILEPEIDIKMADKAEAERLLHDTLMDALADVPDDQQVMLKLSLPEKPNRYLPFIEHPKVLRVVALSGGYSRDEANARLAQNNGMVASFSRALTEGLSAKQDDAAFNAVLGKAVGSIYSASAAG